MNYRLVFYFVPGIIIFFIFLLFPLGEVIQTSFTEWNGISPKIFVGMENFLKLLKDPVFPIALLNNCKFIVVRVSCVPISLFLAYKFRDKAGIFGSLKYFFFLPITFSAVALARVFIYIYAKDGVINQILGTLGLQTKAWLSIPALAPWLVALSCVWITVGWLLIVFLAGYASIPKRYFEAAKIDGASSFQSFFRIHLPLLRPSFIIAFFIIVMNSLRAFPLVQVMTGGGPGHSSEVLATHLMGEAFWSYNMGYAATISVALWIISLGIVIPYLIYTYRRTMRYK